LLKERYPKLCPHSPLVVRARVAEPPSLIEWRIVVYLDDVCVFDWFFEGWGVRKKGELGREPEALELMEKLELDVGDATHWPLYVWRFIGDEGTWEAATSGPYQPDGPIGPVSGSYTFSRFEPWNSRSAEEHAAAIIKTLQD
jgi:hypothetical protein